jgi:hypothetical protein
MIGASARTDNTGKRALRYFAEALLCFKPRRARFRKNHAETFAGTLQNVHGSFVAIAIQTDSRPQVFLF